MGLVTDMLTLLDREDTDDSSAFANLAAFFFGEENMLSESSEQVENERPGVKSLESSVSRR